MPFELDDPKGQNAMAKLVTDNSEAIDTLENDPELIAQYKRDMSQMRVAQEGVQELLGYLFDNDMMTTRSDENHRWIDMVQQRAIPYNYLRRAGETETPSMIKNLRRLQMTQFSEPACRKKWGKEIGFAFAFRDPRRKPTREEKEYLESMECRLQERFFFPAGEKDPSLYKFMGMGYEDFFNLDDITIGVERDMLHQPAGMIMQDPALWYPIVPKVLQYKPYDFDILTRAKIDNMGGEVEYDGITYEEPAADYIMIYNDKRVKAVTSDRLIKSHFFVRSEKRAWKRGYSIMEQAINTATIILNAFTYNAANFSQNRTPLGVLSVTGGFTNQLQLEKLKKILWASMSGVANQRRLPIIGLPEKGDAKWVNIHSTAKDMEFYTGLTLFISILCALSGTNPNELGIASFQDAMRTGGINEENKDGVWKQSKDNGLKTFISHMEGTLNRVNHDGVTVWEEIVKLPVRAVFKGLADEDQANKLKNNIERLKVNTSINEINVEDGKERVDVKIDGINFYDVPGINNPAISAAITAAITRKQQVEDQAKEQAAQAKEQANAQLNPAQPSDRDQELIKKFGSPITQDSELPQEANQ